MRTNDDVSRRMTSVGRNVVMAPNWLSCLQASLIGALSISLLTGSPAAAAATSCNWTPRRSVPATLDGSDASDTCACHRDTNMTAAGEWSRPHTQPSHPNYSLSTTPIACTCVVLTSSNTTCCNRAVIDHRQKHCEYEHRPTSAETFHRLATAVTTHHTVHVGKIAQQWYVNV